MQNPSAAFAPQFKSPSNRYLGLVLTAAINAAVIWAIVNGLNFHPSSSQPTVTTVRFLKPNVQQMPTTKPPKPVLIEPTMARVPVVPKPIIPIEQTTDKNTIAVTATQQKVSTTPSIPDSSASGILDTHTTPPYPPDARNLSQHGTVTLVLSIDATGSVTNAQVRISSGYSGLDQAAMNWVIAHWRYKPAIQNGVASASTSLAAVKFDLRNAR